MSKMKKLAIDKMNQDNDLQTQKFLDDGYRYEEYKLIESTPKQPLSDCCEARISYSEELDENICTECQEKCNVI